jgi:uncharacterized protein YbcC (UPF0753/DUF2309 family)
MSQNAEATHLDAAAAAVALRQPDESGLGARPPVALEAALKEARTRIPPLWPLESFVAVNPFLSLSGERFEDACSTMKSVAGADMLMSRDYYTQLLDEGKITDDDLQQALSMMGLDEEGRSLEEWKAQIVEQPLYAPSRAKTFAEVVDRVSGGRTSEEVTEEIAKWCAAYWDEGQSAWRMPWRSLPFFAAWRAAAETDRTPEVLGLPDFRRVVAGLPADPVAAIAHVVKMLELPDGALSSYFYRALFSVRGWSAYARYLGWYDELDGKEDDRVIQLLAVRLAWDYALFAHHSDTDVRDEWALSVAQMGADEARTDHELVIDSWLQTAFDAAFQRSLFGKLSAASPDETVPSIAKPLQAAFCIDVRSEIFRRALESVSPQAQTIGFAGFFGFPIEFVPIGQHAGAALCPVLLKPKFVVHETVKDADEDEQTEILGLRLLRRRASKAWKSFKSSAVSSFVYVETAGFTFAGKLLSDAMGLTRTVKHPNADGIDDAVLSRIAPEVAHAEVDGRETGFSAAQRLEMAEAVLGAMSLKSNFARLVMLAGHGSTTVNNPHASGLDCGACGGNSGAPNARVAAAILNDPEVRAGLVERGIVVTDQTWFLGCLHDTTTDEVTIFDEEQVPQSHAEDLVRLRGWLSDASELARVERSALLGVDKPEEATSNIFRRTRDWSQTRPEWGLAGNAAFIAAPRSRTRGVDLGGRVFLHDYDYKQDTDWKVLELIMTAPMVVGSWINLQYYGSAVNTDAFGCGNKVLHNVVGTLGVLQGNGGDLQTGLSLQSVHDGERLIHEPLRLNVILEAPTAQIDRILDAHDGVRDLVDNQWLHLFAFADHGRTILRRTRKGEWQKA